MTHHPPPASPAAPASVLGQAKRLYFLLLKTIIVLSITVITALIFVNVVMRYGFNSSIFFTEEVSRLLFVWLVFIGALLVMHEHGHIAVDMLTSRVPKVWQTTLYVLAHAGMLGITWLLLSGAWTQMLINSDVGAPATGIPMAWFYASAVIFASISILIIVHDVIRCLLGRPVEADDAADAPSH